MNSNIAAVSSLIFSAEPNLWASSYSQFQATPIRLFLRSRSRSLPELRSWLRSDRFIRTAADATPARESMPRCRRRDVASVAAGSNA